MYLLQDDLVLNFSLGSLDAEYDKVTFDISGDGVIDGTDLALKLPRAADITYSVGLTKDFNVKSWAASARVSYSYRDEIAYNDNNLGMIDEQDILDIGVDLSITLGADAFLFVASFVAAFDALISSKSMDDSFAKIGMGLSLIHI